jgi:CubicO group peptidase (beta-lactamase class C family)
LDTKFRLASISKLFTEVAILKLVESSRLSLENKLCDFITDYPRGNEITIRHLINHSSGIPNINDFVNYDTLSKFHHNLNEIIELFKYLPLDFDPDTDHNYSNSGYVLLAFIIDFGPGEEPYH